MKSMMMRTLLFFLLTGVTALAEKPWPGVEYAQVRAYAWPKEVQELELIKEDLTLHPGAVNPEGTVLTPEQVQRLLAAVTGKHPEHTQAMCFIPHNAVMFYDAAQKPVAFVVICFGCQKHFNWPEDDTRYGDLVAMAGLFEEMKLPMGEYASKKEFEMAFKENSKPQLTDPALLLPPVDP